jgi:hypothetical protein
MVTRLLAVAVATVSPLVGIAADLAPGGTSGILTMKIRAESSARHVFPPGSGLQAIEWQVKNSGQFSIRVKAVDPMVNPSAANQQAAAAVSQVGDRAVTEQDEEYLNKWQDKEDACNGNEACESKVIAQKMADPRFQSIMQKMQSAAPAAMSAARAVDTTPSYQIWTSDLPNDPAPGSGEMQVDMTEKRLGVADDAGGRFDVTCRWTGKMAIGPNTADFKLAGTVLIDGKASRYELRLPADGLGIRLTPTCTSVKSGTRGPGKTATSTTTDFISLIGAHPPRGVKGMDPVLTVKGPVGSPRRPQIGGKHTTTTDLAGEQWPAPMKVTIEWQFSAGGR